MAHRSLFRDMKVGQTLAIVLNGERVLVSLEEKSGQKARLKFEADEKVVVVRATPEQSGLFGQSGFRQAIQGIKALA